jgi:predicted outer membrane lipoprotein
MLQEQQNTSTPETGYRVGSVWTDLFAKLSGLKYQVKQIILTGLIFALLGLGYSFLKKPEYLARVNFVIEENKQNAGGLFSALAGQVGMDLSSLSGMSGILAGDNVLELLKSPTLLKNVLLTPYPGDTTNTLAYKYAQAYGKLDKYNKLVGGEFLKNSLNSPPNIGGEPSPRQGGDEGGVVYKYNKRVQDSLLTAIATRIIEKELSVYKPDRKLSVFRLDLTTRDELLSQTIATRLIDQAANLYIETKTRRLKLNVDRLQKKSDSIAALLNYRTEASVSKDIINQNPSYVSTEVDVEISNREKGMLSIIYGDVNKSLDITRTALIQETPTIEIIDSPDLPLKKTEVKWYFASVLGLLIGIIFYVLSALWFKSSRV